MSRALLFCIAVVCPVACANGAAQFAEGPAAPRPSAAAMPPPSSSSQSPAVDAGTAQADEAVALAAQIRFPDTTFPPADLDPPFERSARPGDGKWERFGESSRGERLADEPPVMFKTVIHPHPVSRWIALTVVAIDLRYARVDYVPGSEDAKDLKLEKTPLPFTPGLVPEADRDALLVVFNGGFKPRHGNWGMMVAGQRLVPPRDEGCTVGIGPEGEVVIRSWPALSGTIERLRSYRQTPPCLVEQGAVHPDLVAYRERAWGGRDPKRKTRRRSALGVDETGRVLLYGMGDEAGPRELAFGMKHAGVESAAQLDINWSWTRFLVFGRPSPEAELQVTSTLIPKMVHRRTGYVERPAGRDFFYVTRRLSTDVGNSASGQ